MAVKVPGIGMPSDDLPKIFDQFYQIEKQGSRQGTGLGLSLTKGFVELHDPISASQLYPSSGEMALFDLGPSTESRPIGTMPFNHGEPVYDVGD